MRAFSKGTKNVLQPSKSPVILANTPTTIVVLRVDQSSTAAPTVTGILSNIADSFNSQLIGPTQIVGVQSQQVLSSQFEHIDLFVPQVIGLNVLTTDVLGTAGMNPVSQQRNTKKTR